MQNSDDTAYLEIFFFFSAHYSLSIYRLFSFSLPQKMHTKTECYWFWKYESIMAI